MLFKHAVIQVFLLSFSSFMMSISSWFGPVALLVLSFSIWVLILPSWILGIGPCPGNCVGGSSSLWFSLFSRPLNTCFHLFLICSSSHRIFPSMPLTKGILLCLVLARRWMIFGPLFSNTSYKFSDTAYFATWLLFPCLSCSALYIVIYEHKYSGILSKKGCSCV